MLPDRDMLSSLGPSGLLRLAAMVLLGLSMLTSCAAVPDRRLSGAVVADDSHRCEPDPTAALAVLCLEP